MGERRRGGPLQRWDSHHAPRADAFGNSGDEPSTQGIFVLGLGWNSRSNRLLAPSLALRVAFRAANFAIFSHSASMPWAHVRKVYCVFATVKATALPTNRGGPARLPVRRKRCTWIGRFVRLLDNTTLTPGRGALYELVHDVVALPSVWVVGGMLRRPACSISFFDAVLWSPNKTHCTEHSVQAAGFSTCVRLGQIAAVWSHAHCACLSTVPWPKCTCA